MNDEVSYEKKALRELLEAGTKLLSGRSEEEVLHSILLGLKALGFDRVRLYLLSDDRQYLVPKDHLGMDGDFMQTPRLVDDDRPMQVLLQKRQVHLFRSEEVGSSSFGANEWICAPLIIQGEIIGKLSADNKLSSRPIAEDECETVALFAVQAAAAIEHNRLLTNSEWQAQKLEAILKVSNSLSSSLDQKNILTTACHEAVNLLGVDHSAIALFNPTLEVGILHAEYPEMGMLGGQPIQLKGVPAEEQLIRSKRPVVIADVANDISLGPIQKMLMARNIRSVVLAPIVSKDKVLGSFSLDSIGEARTFSQEETALCVIFARQIAVAIENKRLFDEAKQQKEYFLSLGSKFPHAIITSDLQGKIRFFNDRARELLKYSATDAIPADVWSVYADTEEPRKIRDMLQDGGGKLTAYETDLQSKDKTHIPVRLSATWLYDIHQQRLGVVGYFDDLRSLRTAEERLQLLLDASNTVAHTNAPTDGLRNLAKLIVSSLPHSFCRILLVDEQRAFLSPKAAYPVERTDRPLEWDPRLDKRIAINDIPGLGDLLNTGKPRVVRWSIPAARSSLTEFSQHLRLKQGVQSVLMVPLKIRDKLVGLLEVGELRRETRSPITRKEKDLVFAIASQSTILIDRLRRQMVSEHRHALLGALVEKSRYLRPEDGESGLLQQAVGLARDLVEGAASGLYVHFTRLRQVELKHSSGPFHKILAIPHGQEDTLASQVARTGSEVTVCKYSVDSPESKTPNTPLVVIGVPLKHVDEVEHVLVVAYTPAEHDFIEVDAEILQRFANRVSMVVHTAQAMDPEHRKLRLAPLLLKISDYMQTTKDLDKIGHVLLTGVTAGYGLGFNRAGLFLVDEACGELVGKLGIGYLQHTEAQRDWKQLPQEGREEFQGYLRSVEAGPLVRTPVGEAIANLRIPLRECPDTRFVRCFTGETADIVSAAELSTLPPQFSAAFKPSSDLVLVPLKTRGRVLGLMVADNKFIQDPITPDDVDVLMMLANTAALAIDNVQLLQKTEAAERRLRSLYEASEILLSTSFPEGLLSAIAQQAQKAFQGESVAVWGYDPQRGEFLPSGVVAAATRKGLWAQARQLEPEWRPVAQHLLEQGWVGVSNVDDPQYTELIADSVREWWQAVGIRSYQGVALTVGNEPLGVVYVYYNRPRRFTDEEETLLRTFGNHAALALKKAFLFEQLTKANVAANVLAEVTTLGDLAVTLDAVTDGTLKAINCDAVTLYAYDQATERVSSPPKVAGVIHEDGVRRREQVPSDSIIWTMLKRDERYVVEIIESDEFLATTRFAKEENIKSCVVFPLKAAGWKVGVMFVNYRTRHRFSDEELSRLQLFANQAAVAIHNAQLYEQAQKQADALQALHEAGQVITSSLDSAEVLRRIGKQAWRLTRDHGEPLGVANVWHLDNDQLKLVAAYPSSAQELLPKVIDLHPQTTTKIGVVGRAARMNQAQLVMNVANDPDYIAANETNSELAVPITLDGKVIGVINVEDPHLNAFQEQDIQVLEALAAQAGIAIKNAVQYEDLNRTKGQLAARTAVAWMGMASASWKHSTRIAATTIRDLVKLALQDMKNEQASERLRQRLGSISDISRRILETPIVEPLSTEKSQPVIINNFIQERIMRRWSVQVDEVTKDVEYSLCLSDTKSQSVRVNHQWLAQAFDILVYNACEAMTESKVQQIAVITKLSNDSVDILIRDTGRGIPEEKRPYLLLEPDKKLSGEKGSGMGLLLAQTIVQAYGGEIHIGSTGPTGTTMIIRLPKEPQEMVSEQTTEGGNILLVSGERKSSWLTELRDVLSPFGAPEVRGEDEVLQRTQQKRYDLIIVDGTLVGDLVFLIKRLRAQEPEAKIIVVGSSPEWWLARDAFRAGATDYIYKSMYSDEMKRILNRIFRQQTLVAG